MDGLNVGHLFLLLVALILVLKLSFSFIVWIVSFVFANRLVDVIRGNRQRESRDEADPALSSDRPFDDDDISTDFFEHLSLIHISEPTRPY